MVIYVALNFMLLHHPPCMSDGQQNEIMHALQAAYDITRSELLDTSVGDSAEAIERPLFSVRDCQLSANCRRAEGFNLAWTVLAPGNMRYKHPQLADIPLTIKTRRFR